jgi:hypothetical protein
MKYSIIGKMKTGNKLAEIIDTAENLKEAKFMLQEYKTAFGNTWDLLIQKNLITK